MIDLFVLHWKHLLRSRLLAVSLLFVVCLEVFVLRGLQSMSVQLDGVIAPVDWRQMLLFGSFLELGAGAFAAAACGIWLIPYLHQGSRAQISFLWPVRAINISLSYLLLLIVLLFLQRMVSLSLFFLLNKTAPIFAAEIPWTAVGKAWCLEVLSGATLAFWLASSTLLLGPVATFFLAGFLMGSMQLLGSLLKVSTSSLLASYFEGKLDGLRAWYKLLPPFGDVLFQLRAIFKLEPLGWGVWVQWLVWIALGVACFTVCQRFQLGKRLQDP